MEKFFYKIYFYFNDLYFNGNEKLKGVENMKKLLSILSSLTLISSAATTVVACGGEDTPVPPPAPPPNPKESPQQIAKLISDTNLFAPSNINPNTKNEGTIATLKNILQKSNPGITEDYLNFMSFSDETLDTSGQGNPTEVILTITEAGFESTTVNLQVTVLATADQIKKKIDISDPVRTDIGLKSNVQAYTGDTDTINAINAKLKSENPSLTASDLKTITYQVEDLENDGSEDKTPVLATITDDQGITATVLLQVWIHPTAKQIAAKITKTTFSLDATFDSSTPATSTTINKALQVFNPTLTAYDLENIKYSGTLEANKVASITVHIEDDVLQKDDSVTLTLTKVSGNQAKAEAIKAQIAKTRLTIDPPSNLSTGNATTITLLKQSLQANNPNLENSAMNAISFGVMNLSLQQTNAVTVNITVGKLLNQGRASITVYWQLIGESRKIANKITTRQYYLRAGTNTSTTDPGTITALKAAIKAKNSLTDAELAMISFAPATLKGDGSENFVDVTAVVSNPSLAGDKVNVPLKVAIHPTAAQIAAKIIIIQVDVPGTSDPSVLNTTTKQAIIDQVALQNNLNAWDASKIDITKAATLQKNQYVKVQLALSDDAKPTAGSDTLNITVRLANLADTIKDKISVTNLRIASNANVSTSNSTTIANIKSALQTANPDLTNNDLSYISVEAGLTLDKTGSAVTTAVVLTITAPDQTSETVNTNIIINPTANQFASELDSISFDVSSDLSASTKDPATQEAIKAAIAKQANVSPYKEAMITNIATVTLTPNTAVAVSITVEDDQGTQAQGSITVKRVNSAQVIVDKITKTSFNINPVANSSTTNSDTITKLKAGLQAANSNLTNSDLAKISFAKSFLDNSGHNTAVKLNGLVADNGNLANFEMDVTVRSSAAQIAAKVVNVQTLLRGLNLPNQGRAVNQVNFQGGTANDNNAINQVQENIRYDNNSKGMVVYEVRYMSFVVDSGGYLVLGQLNPVTATITDANGDTATVQIVVDFQDIS